MKNTEKSHHEPPKIYADFNNADIFGRIRLICLGTIKDLSRLGVQLSAGLSVALYMEELVANATVAYSEEEKIWVAVIDENGIGSNKSSV